MRLDQLRVELRPRSAWEAIELGTALVRTHAAAIWKPWLLVTLPVFALLNAVAWAFDLVWVAGLAMWWLKPVFDRIPLYVVSRAVFGDAPTVRETVAAQRRWGWRAMPGYLTWRRLGVARSLYLPVDLLEGGADPAQRRRVIGGSARGIASMLTLACVNFEIALVCGGFALALMFVPVELLSESARAAWTLFLGADPPRWVELAYNAVAWLATSVVEPFFVGAGFGMYLDRRTQIEAWDIEIALRRMRQRLGGTVAMLACGLALALSLPNPARAQQAPAPVQGGQAPARAAQPAGKGDAGKKKAPPGPPTLPRVFGQAGGEGRFARSVEQAYRDPLLRPTRTQVSWEKRKPDDKPKPGAQGGYLLRGIAKVFAAIAEYGLWMLAGLLALLLVATHKTWLPWLRGIAPVARVPEPPVSSEPHADAEALPDDIAAAVRSLWQEGRRRRALALLYRASVDWMAARTGATLLPGATESDCLRAARGLREDGERDVFGRVVRVWQYAAYAQRLPDDEAFESLLAQAAGRFGWSA